MRMNDMERRDGVVGGYGPFGLDYDTEQKRLHNLEVCERFLELEGESRTVERWRQGLVTDDGSMALTFAEGGDPRQTPQIPFGWKQMAGAYEQGMFHDNWRHWRLSNATIYTTPDPDLIFIECDGQSMLYDDTAKGDYGYYLNHYILIASFVEGKIHRLEEVYNPAAVYFNFGWHREPPLF